MLRRLISVAFVIFFAHGTGAFFPTTPALESSPCLDCARASAGLRLRGVLRVAKSRASLLKLRCDVARRGTEFISRKRVAMPANYPEEGGELIYVDEKGDDDNFENPEKTGATSRTCCAVCQSSKHVCRETDAVFVLFRVMIERAQTFQGATLC